MTVTFGWWLLPLAITAVAWGTSLYDFDNSTGGYGIGSGIYNGALVGRAMVLTLVVWLVYFAAA